MIDPLPSAPSRQLDDPATFSDKADAFVAALPLFREQSNNAVVGINFTAEIPMWSVATTYSRGNVVWSPITYLAYRLKSTTLTGGADPSANPTAWAQATGTGNVSSGAAASFSDLTVTGNVTGAGFSQFATLSGAQVLTNKTLGAGTVQAVSLLREDIAKPTTTGNSVLFTGIPSWARRVTVMLDRVSATGANEMEIVLGTTSGLDAVGYSGGGSRQSASGTAGQIWSTGFLIYSNAAAQLISGHCVLTKVGGETWVASLALGSPVSSFTVIAGGSKTLNGALDRIQLKTTSTDQFDSGSVNIFWE